MELLGIERLQRNGDPAEKGGTCIEQDESSGTEAAVQGECTFSRGSCRRAGGFSSWDSVAVKYGRKKLFFIVILGREPKIHCEIRQSQRSVT